MGHLQTVQILMRLWEMTNSSDPYETIGPLQTVQILVRLLVIFKQFRLSCDYRKFTYNSYPHETMGHFRIVQVLMRL